MSIFLAELFKDMYGQIRKKAMAEIDKIPSEAWVGKVDGQWPLDLFVSEGHAIAWVKGSDLLERRRIFKVHIEVLDELEVVQQPAFLRSVRERATTHDDL